MLTGKSGWKQEVNHTTNIELANDKNRISIVDG
jgi:hypothetical protein